MADGAKVQKKDKSRSNKALLNLCVINQTVSGQNGTLALFHSGGSTNDRRPEYVIRAHRSHIVRAVH